MKKRMLGLLLVLALCLSLMPAPALAAASIAISKTSALIDLADQKTLQLDATYSPSSYGKYIQWKSGSTSIAAVSKNGLVAAKKVGTTKIGVRLKGKTSWSFCNLTVKDSNRPTSITLNETAPKLVKGETLQLSATLKPSSAVQSVTWKSSKTSIATVSSTGVVTAKKAGKCQIRATSTYNKDLKKTITLTVLAAPAPTKVVISPGVATMNVKDKLALTAKVSPAEASQNVTWASSKTSIATVSSKGVVTAKKAGTVKIRAKSKAKSSIYDIITITVTDPNAITSLSISDDDMFLSKGSSKTLNAVITPSSCTLPVTWKSSAPTIVSVTTSGKITALKAGTATITATAGSKKDTVQVTVLSDERSTTLPANTLTSASGISANRQKISAIFESAMSELQEAYASGKISSSERATRKEIIQRGFVMYDIAWSPKSNVRYWSSSSDTYYKSSLIYIGLPYTQTNRTFNRDKWLNNVSSTESDGYFHVTMPNTSYPGNDCSSFVSMCQFGMNTSSSYLNTSAMYTSTQYKTVTDGFTKMIPGDVLVKNGHTAMFLYYVTSDKIMVIEQGGGSEPNTVACHIKTISGTYKPQGYRVRRKASLPSA